jgi:hypothetical protein
MKSLPHLLLGAAFCFACWTSYGQADSLVQKSYEVTPNFVTRLGEIEDDSGASGAAVDPFAEPSKPAKKPKAKSSIQEQFGAVGVSFDGDAQVTYDPTSSVITHTNIPHQIGLLESYLDHLREMSEKQIVTYYEWIEVDRSDFSDWLFRNTLESAGTELRNEVQKWIEEDKAEVVKSTTLITRSGQRGRVESVDEFMYPTEYHPPNVPNKVSLKEGAEAPVEPAAPTAYQTRDLGTTLELDAVLGVDSNSYSLNLSSEDSHLVRIDAWHHHADDPAQQAQMPVFHSMRVNTQISGTDGKYVFLGSATPGDAENPDRKNPLTLQFLRCDVSALFDWKEINTEAAEPPQ